mgnify:CR=1 FL=1
MWDDIISAVKLVDDDIEGGRSMLQESNRIEFKAELNDKLEKEIGAFLNNKEGGVLYIGVDDNGNPVGMPNIDSMQLKIADRIKNNILPSTLGLFDIVTEEIDKVSVVKILISSGLEKPYYIKKQVMSPNGCFTRVVHHLNQCQQQGVMSFIENKFIIRGLELNEKFANWKNFFSRLGTDIFFCYRENIILKTLKLPMSKGNE